MRKPPATATPFTFRWRASPRLYGLYGGCVDAKINRYHLTQYRCIVCMKE